MSNEISLEIIQNFLNKNEIKLKATQEKLSIPVLKRIFKKMKGGIKFANIYVKNELICDGHHRYIASLLAEYPIESVLGETTSTTSVVPWNSITLLQDDYDTDAHIKVLNTRDAKYNNLTEDEILELMK